MVLRGTKTRLAKIGTNRMMLTQHNLPTLDDHLFSYVVVVTL